MPSGSEYGTWAGKTVQLQFNGFGNLQGIPGYCVNPQDNSEVDCGPNTRYVPAFSIADGETMTLNHSDNTTTTLKVTGMTCNHCVMSVTKALKSVPGVESADVSLAKAQAVVQGDADRQAMIAAVKEEGYEATLQG